MGVLQGEDYRHMRFDAV